MTSDAFEEGDHNDSGYSPSGIGFEDELRPNGQIRSYPLLLDVWR
jgi:hypothetical protein